MEIQTFELESNDPLPDLPIVKKHTKPISQSEYGGKPLDLQALILAHVKAEESEII